MTSDVLRLAVLGPASAAALLARYGRDDMEDVFLDIARDRRAMGARP